MRLRRPMCGKALPFRNATLYDEEAVPPRRGAASLDKTQEQSGKAEPYRTSGGKAA
jgi:hypothetical protein